MIPITPVVIVICLASLFVLYKILVFLAPVSYTICLPEILKKLSFQMITSGLRSDEIYTANGKIKAAIQKKAEKREEELYKLFEDDFDYIMDQLRNKKLITRSGGIRKIKTGRIKRALWDYYNHGKNIRVRNLESDVMTFGITPEQFLILKKQIKTDATGVYVIYNATQQKYYVGQATRLYFRVWQHFTGHGNGDVYADYKYGNHFIIRFITLSESGYDNLDHLERDMIEHYNAFTTGYNKTIGNHSWKTKTIQGSNTDPYEWQTANY